MAGVNEPKKIRVVKAVSDLKKPGDIYFLGSNKGFIFRCWCDQTFGSDRHHVAQRKPVTIFPSLGCPNLCHGHIRKGFWHAEADSREPQPQEQKR